MVCVIGHARKILNFKNGQLAYSGARDCRWAEASVGSFRNGITGCLENRVWNADGPPTKSDSGGSRPHLFLKLFPVRKCNAWFGRRDWCQLLLLYSISRTTAKTWSQQIVSCSRPEWADRSHAGGPRPPVPPSLIAESPEWGDIDRAASLPRRHRRAVSAR